MMSVLQDVEGLTKLYFPGGRSVSMHNFRFNVYMVYKGMASIIMWTEFFKK